MCLLCVFQCFDARIISRLDLFFSIEYENKKKTMVRSRLLGPANEFPPSFIEGRRVLFCFLLFFFIARRGFSLVRFRVYPIWAKETKKKETRIKKRLATFVFFYRRIFCFVFGTDRGWLCFNWRE